jgi:hypothetical protein
MHTSTTCLKGGDIHSHRLMHYHLLFTHAYVLLAIIPQTTTHAWMRVSIYICVCMCTYEHSLVDIVLLLLGLFALVIVSRRWFACPIVCDLYIHSTHTHVCQRYTSCLPVHNARCLAHQHSVQILGLFLIKLRYSTHLHRYNSYLRPYLCSLIPHFHHTFTFFPASDRLYDIPWYHFVLGLSWPWFTTDCVVHRY